jgi:hypothetical protein
MANTTNYNWETPDDTDLVKDGAAAIRTLGNSVDTTTKALNPETTLGDIAYRSATSNTNTRLPIGTAGQILAVSGGVPAWINNDQGDITEVQAGTGISVASGTGPIPVVTNTVATEFDAKGDLVVGTGSDTFDRLAVGTNTYILTADSAEATGLKWVAPAAGGKVLQVVSTTKTNTFSSSSTSFTDITDLSLSITPSSATSKIMVFANANGQGLDGSVTMAVRLVRGSTAISVGDAAAGKTQVSCAISRSANTLDAQSFVCNFLDSPNTTSATTYKLQAIGTGGTFYINVTDNDQYRFTSSITAFEIGA